LKTPTTGSSAMLAEKAEEIVEFIRSELEALDNYIGIVPQTYAGFQDMAMGIRSCIDELEDGEDILRGIGTILEHREQINE